MKKEKRFTIHDLIAEIYNVRPNYVKSILKIGDSGELGVEYFERIRDGRIAVYVAYSACVSAGKKVKQPVPKEKEAVIFTPETSNTQPLEMDSPEVVTKDLIQKLELKEGEAIPESIEYQSEDGVIHIINLKQFIYHEK